MDIIVGSCMRIVIKMKKVPFHHSKSYFPLLFFLWVGGWLTASGTTERNPTPFRRDPDRRPSPIPSSLQASPSPLPAPALSPMATDPTPPAAVAAAPRYSLPPVRLPAEDILFCVDVDLEVSAEMKSAASAPSSASASASTASPPPQQQQPGPRPAVRRMDAVKQALLLFVHSKLTMCPDHRFAFASIGETVSMVWRRP